MKRTTAAAAALTAAVLAGSAGTAAAGHAGFVDVDGGDTHSPAIHWASENGVVGGYPGGKFHPNQKVTRAQLMTVLREYHERFHGDGSYPDTEVR